MGQNSPLADFHGQGRELAKSSFQRHWLAVRKTCCLFVSSRVLLLVLLRPLVVGAIVARCGNPCEPAWRDSLDFRTRETIVTPQCQTANLHMIVSYENLPKKDQNSGLGLIFRIIRDWPLQNDYPYFPFVIDLLQKSLASFACQLLQFVTLCCSLCS